MNGNGKEYNKEKTLFRSYYCSSCKQMKPCGLLTGGDNELKSYCCKCYFQSWQARSQEYLDYQVVFQQEVKKQQDQYKQYQLLKSYQGCKVCRSLEVDAYDLYVENKLVCQPCLVRKEGGSSSPISFLEQQKWYKKSGGIDLKEWLEHFQCLPVDAECAREGLKNKEHLKNCQCLEKEVRKTVEFYTNSLREYQQKLAKCSCKKSEKVRVDSDYSTNCESCEKTIPAASKKRVIKNRNDPKFGGLEIKEKVLCLNCLQKFQEKMPISKRYTLNKYLKRGY